MTSFIRRTVSQNRIRYVDDHFDLDLTYITDRIIAMGYPSDKTFQGLIRNPINQVSKLLKEKHQDSFRVFNLCIESKYNFSHFDNKVEMFPMHDHCPPRFTQISKFCESMNNWLNENSDNVAIVHCKAGKGRTGTMISCYFVYSSQFPDPIDAMNEFSNKRCKDGKGVTIPSQRRYVEYYADYILNKRVYKSTEILLKSIEISSDSETEHFPDKLKLKIYDYGINAKIYVMKQNKTNKQNILVFDLPNPLKLRDDIDVNFFTKSKECLLKIVFNTFCLLQDNKYSNCNESFFGKKELKKETNEIYWSLKKKEIDIAYKNKDLDENITVKFVFQIPDNNKTNSDFIYSSNLSLADETSWKNGFVNINNFKININSKLEIVNIRTDNENNESSQLINNSSSSDLNKDQNENKNDINQLNDLSSVSSSSDLNQDINENNNQSLSNVNSSGSDLNKDQIENKSEINQSTTPKLKKKFT